MAIYAISDHSFYGDGPGFGNAQKVMSVISIALCLLVLAPASVAARGLALAVSGVVALAMGEVAGQAFLAQRIRTPYVADPDVIFRLEPGVTTESILPAINGGRRIVQHVNSDGFRGPELLPAGAERRILVYGDSFIHAFYSPLEETFPFQLEERLEETVGTPFEVVNAGISSYGPDQILLRLEREIPRFQPDLVIVAIFSGNDYGDLLRNRMFTLEPDGPGIRRGDWRLSDELEVGFDLNWSESILRRAVRERLGSRRSATVATGDPLAAMLEFSLAEARREYQEFIVDGSRIITNAKNDYFSADVSLEPTSESAEYQAALMDRVLGGMHAFARGADVPLVFLFIPHPLDVYGGFLGGTVDTDRYPDYSPDNLMAPLSATAVRIGAHHVDLAKIFRQEQEGRPSHLYLRGGDDHWNAAGQALAAEHMASFLIEQQLLGQ